MTYFNIIFSLVKGFFSPPPAFRLKFHLLHVMADAPIAADYAAGTFSCLSLEEYGSLLTQCLKEFPETTVIHRITGDGARRGLVAPLWSLDKKQVLNYLNNLLQSAGLFDQRGL